MADQQVLAQSSKLLGPTPRLEYYVTPSSSQNKEELGNRFNIQKGIIERLPQLLHIARATSQTINNEVQSYEDFIFWQFMKPPEDSGTAEKDHGDGEEHGKASSFWLFTQIPSETDERFHTGDEDKDDGSDICERDNQSTFRDFEPGPVHDEDKMDLDKDSSSTLSDCDMVEGSQSSSPVVEPLLQARYHTDADELSQPKTPTKKREEHKGVIGPSPIPGIYSSAGRDPDYDTPSKVVDYTDTHVTEHPLGRDKRSIEESTMNESELEITKDNLRTPRKPQESAESSPLSAVAPHSPTFGSSISRVAIYIDSSSPLAAKSAAVRPVPPKHSRSSRGALNEIGSSPTALGDVNSPLARKSSFVQPQTPRQGRPSRGPGSQMPTPGDNNGSQASYSFDDIFAGPRTPLPDFPKMSKIATALLSSSLPIIGPPYENPACAAYIRGVRQKRTALVGELEALMARANKVDPLCNWELNPSTLVAQASRTDKLQEHHEDDFYETLKGEGRNFMDIFRRGKEFGMSLCKGHASNLTAINLVAGRQVMKPDTIPTIFSDTCSE